MRGLEAESVLQFLVLVEEIGGDVDAVQFDLSNASERLLIAKMCINLRPNIPSSASPCCRSKI